MNLLEYISDSDRKNALAAAIGKSPAYLYLVATGWRNTRASPELAQAIEKASGGDLRCGEGQGMRPDLQWIRDADGAVTGYFVPAEREKVA